MVPGENGKNGHNGGNGHNKDIDLHGDAIFRELVQSVRDYAIFVLDPAGRVMTWNPGAEAIKGYRAEEIVGSHFSRFYPDDKIESGWPQHELAEAAEHGRFEDEGWRVRKDGSRFWALVVITAIRNSAGKLIGFSKVTRDLSERKVQEEQLRHSEERFRTLIADVKDYAIFIVDFDGRIASWNAGAERMHGYAPGEIIGSHISRFYEADAIKRGWAEHELRMATMEGRFEDEGWRVRKDGSRFWASVIITAMRDKKGDLLGFSKITRDLTERRKHEQELAESEERFRLLLQGVADYSIVMLDHGGSISSWNTGAQALTGYAANEMIGKHFSHLYSSEDVRENKPWRHLLAANETGRVAEESWRVRKDGTQFWANSVITALFSVDRQHRGYVYVMHDLSDRRHAESLADTTERMHEFIAMLAHELRNPIAPIRNAVELMSRKGLGDPTLEAMRQVIERQTGHLAQIIDELLDVNRIARGEFSITKDPVDLCEILNSAIEGARPLIDRQGQSLTIEWAKESVVVQGDALRLTQVFVNLLNNAAKFTPPGGTISLGIVRRRTDVEITVRDNGNGIAEGDLERVFDLFTQAAPNTGGAGGLGVGLAFVRRVVELHAGTVRAESEGIGQGSAFIVRLPLPIEHLTLVSDQSRAASEVELPNYRIVVADDNRDAADSLQLLLQALGQDVYTVYDGATALQAIERFKPQVVMLDIGMPDISGYQVVERLRAKGGRKLPVLMAITGWGALTDKNEALARGFDYHITKPASAAALHSAIADIASKLGEGS